MSKLSVGALIAQYKAAYRARYGLSAQQAKVLGALSKCRTAALGGHVQVCEQCGVVRVWYNSCRDRHCPRCQSGAKAAWVAARRAELLPVGHFHLVFTVPAVLHELLRHNERLGYGLLFQTAWSSLKTLCADPRYLGGRPGMLAVLHTWGQNLHYHPHIHALVPAGGLSFDRCRWQASRHKGYLVPVRALSRLFRGRLVGALRQAHRQGELIVPSGVSLLRVLDQAMQQDWVVYAKKPFGRATKLVDYLGRYLKRVAISDDRLLRHEAGQVHFTYRDYAQGGKRKVMALAGVEFVRRFVQHILPAGFCKVRYYGILANRYRQRTIALCHYLLGQWYQVAPSPSPLAALAQDQDRCTHCGEGQWVSLYYFEYPSRAPPGSVSGRSSSEKAGTYTMW